MYRSSRKLGQWLRRLGDNGSRIFWSAWRTWGLCLSERNNFDDLQGSLWASTHIDSRSVFWGCDAHGIIHCNIRGERLFAMFSCDAS
mmetsp:Transcript_142494/g.454706  ORF Transcript_142494/g.454706 Transcript_142494/m.454706 type:complete len:87 (-) Transcript_142494:387-647(-)